MNTQLKSNMEKLINASLDAGADSADVILSKGNSFSLNAQNEKIDKYQVSGSQVMGVRVIKDNKVGLSYTESLDDESITSIAKAAVENAINSEENPYEAIDLKDQESIHKSEFSKDETPTSEKIDFCLSLEADVKKRESLVSAVPYNGFSETDHESYYLNSHGTFSFESEYYQTCYTSALVKDGDESSMHYHASQGRKMLELDKESCINESITHAKEWLRAKPLATGNYDVVFTLDTFAEVFGCFSNIFSGKGAMEKTNPFADRMGEMVMNEKISIQDIPQYKDAFFKSYCDSEGYTHKDLSLIENGVLKSFYHNSATAKFFNTKTTAHASRGAKTALGTSGTTKVFGVGETSESDFNSGEFFEVHSLQGLHSGANAISGEFSFGASGYFVKDGQRVKPVKGVTVSGNFHKMLLGLNILGSKLEHTTSKGFFAPRMRFENISIAG